MEKLNCKSLMIGDWVMFPNSIEKVQEVAYVEGKGYCASFAASATLFPIPIDKLKPISLTPEILEKNGFIEINDDKKWYKMKLLEENDFVGLEKLEDNYWMFGAVVFPNLINQLFFKYVHELQHALKLCGIEKNIII